MKISPMPASSGGQPGQQLGNVEVGRTANPMKLERARAIARGEKVSDVPTEQVEQPRPNVRSIKMRTNFSTNRDDAPLEDPAQVPEQQPSIETASDPAAQSSNPDAVEPGAVEAIQPLSPQFAALAKQKRALQLERAEFEKQKAEIHGKPQGISQEDLKARAATDPLGVLQDLGVTYDALTEAILSDKQQDNPKILALEQKIAALEKGVNETFQTNEQKQEESALTEMLYEAEALAKEGENFEMIRTEDGYDQVLRLIHDTYKKTGRVLGVEEAMTTVENHLLARAEKLASITKVRNKIAAPQLQPAAQAQSRGMKTLTARDTATPVMDRRARAIAAMTGTLRK